MPRCITLLLARRGRGHADRVADARLLEYVAEGIAMGALAKPRKYDASGVLTRWTMLESDVVVSCVAFSRHGDRMATAHGGNREVAVYEGGSGRKLARFGNASLIDVGCHSWHHHA